MPASASSPIEVFPLGDPAELLRYAVRIATLAPSGHNTQPWLFRIHGNSVMLFADRSRALPVVDPHDRELVMSCGAALHHLTTCLAAFGEVPDVSLSLDGEHPDPDLLAIVRLGERRQPDERALRWLRAAHLRRTTRFAFDAIEVAPELVEALVRAAAEQGATFHALSPGGRRQLAHLVAEGDREQLTQKPFRRELAAWVHPNRSRQLDGIPGYAQGIGDWMSAIGPFVVRTFDIGESQAAKDERLLVHSPVVAVLGTPDDSQSSHVRAGQALSAVLLEATSAGLAASFLNQPVEVPALRPHVAELFRTDGPAIPQLVLRIGYYGGPPLQTTPRRDLASVLC